MSAGTKGMRKYPTPTKIGAPREVFLHTSDNLVAGAESSTTIKLGKGVKLLRVSTNRPARIRLYTTVAQRDADLARVIGVDPTANHGLLMEVVTTVAVLGLDLGPEVLCSCMESVVTTNIAANIQNKDTVAGAVVTTFTRQVLEG